MEDGKYNDEQQTMRNQVVDKVLLLTKFGRNSLDNSQEIVFLNERCLTCMEIVDKLVPYLEISCSEQTLSQLEEYQNSIFEDVMLHVAPVLSAINNVKFSEKYWKYYVAFEFGFLFYAYYSMYIQIKNVITKYPGIKIVCFEDDEYDIAKLCISSAKYKSYMFQLIGKQILAELNYAHICVKKIKLEDYFIETRKNVVEKKYNVRDFIRKGYDRMYKILSKKSPFLITYSFSDNIRNLQRKLIGRAYFTATISNKNILDKNVDVEKRRILEETIFINGSEDEFRNIFIKNIGYNLSRNYIENYNAIRIATKQAKRMKATTCIKFLYDPLAMEYAAYLKENGGKIVECSHSIEEGWRLWKSPLLSQTDYFFSWSTKEYLSYNNYNECVSYMTSSVEEVNYMDNKNILYARGAETTPYPTCVADLILNQEINMYETVVRPIKFYDELDDNLQQRILYRNRDDWEEESRNFVEQHCPNIQFDDSFENGRFRSFSEQIKNSRIVVVESIHSTSFFQAIMYGVPTIIIENLDYRGLLNDAVLDLLEELKKVDVWFEDAVKAGKVINENYEKIDDWWNMTERRNVIKKIQNQLWVSLDGKSESEWWEEALDKLI